MALGPGISQIISFKKERNMRKYRCQEELETVICNCCGKKLIVKNGILREGAIHIDHAWDSFSEKDGEIHHLDLCENCYDEIISGFRIAVEKEPAVEMI